jgi:hypothetical protein
MSKRVLRFCALACLVIPATLVGIAEAQQAPPTSTPQVLVDGDPGVWTVKPAVAVKAGAPVKK